MDENLRDEIESRRDQMTAGPNESAFEQMEQAADEFRQQAEQNPEYTQGQDIPVQDVPEGEGLDRPVGTESDSY